MGDALGGHLSRPSRSSAPAAKSWSASTARIAAASPATSTVALWITAICGGGKGGIQCAERAPQQPDASVHRSGSVRSSAATVRAGARFLSASTMARSTAVLWPPITIWPGALVAAAGDHFAPARPSHTSANGPARCRARPPCRRRQPALHPASPCERALTSFIAGREIERTRRDQRGVLAEAVPGHHHGFGPPASEPGVPPPRRPPAWLAAYWW